MCKNCQTGVYLTQVGGEYMSSPAQADYECNICGHIQRLTQDQYPGIKTEVIGLDI
jgi:hypothetical protein